MELVRHRLQPPMALYQQTKGKEKVALCNNSFIYIPPFLPCYTDSHNNWDDGDDADDEITQKSTKHLTG